MYLCVINTTLMFSFLNMMIKYHVFVYQYILLCCGSGCGCSNFSSPVVYNVGLDPSFMVSVTRP